MKYDEYDKHTHTLYWLLMLVTGRDVRMSRGVQINMMYAFGDQGKTASTVLFYRRWLIAAWCPASPIHLRTPLALGARSARCFITLDFWCLTSLHSLSYHPAAWCHHDKRRKERGKWAWQGTDTGLVGGRLLFFLKMMAHLSPLLFPSASTPRHSLLRALKRGRLPAWAQLVTRTLARLHSGPSCITYDWMWGGIHSEGGKLFDVFYLNVRHIRKTYKRNT